MAFLAVGFWGLEGTDRVHRHQVCCSAIRAHGSLYSPERITHSLRLECRRTDTRAARNLWSRRTILLLALFQSVTPARHSKGLPLGIHSDADRPAERRF